MGFRVRCVFAAALISTGAVRAVSLVEAPVTSLPAIATSGDPANYAINPPSSLSSVARLAMQVPGGTAYCTGSLVGGGDYILTAAHCIASESPTPIVNSLSATFNTASGPRTFSGAEYYLPAGWNGDFRNGSDIALVRLSAVTGLTPYDIFRVDDPFLSDMTIHVAGYGRYFRGSEGLKADSPSGTLHAGYNTLDGVAFGNIPGQPFAWDFDSGEAANDTFSFGLLPPNTGLGEAEVGVAPGDSGGPSFISGQIAGVHSFVQRYGVGDIDGVLNFSFGEVSADTRVAAYAGWLDSVMQPIPEPGTALLLAGGVAAVLARRRRRRSL